MLRFICVLIPAIIFSYCRIPSNKYYFKLMHLSITFFCSSYIVLYLCVIYFDLPIKKQLLLVPLVTIAPSFRIFAHVIFAQFCEKPYLCVCELLLGCLKWPTHNAI